MTEKDQIHVTWGPEGAALSDAERKIITDGLLATARQNREEHDRAVKALEGLPYVAVPIDQLADIYERFKRLTKLGQATIEEWTALPKEAVELKHAIFCEADFGALHAGQWLPKDVRETARQAALTPRPSDCG